MNKLISDLVSVYFSTLNSDTEGEYEIIDIQQNEDSAWKRKIKKTILNLDDQSDRIDIGLNSAPGITEEKINGWVKKTTPTKPFYVRVSFGNVVGSTKDGKSIRGADIYVVNPHKVIGFWWWKKVKMIRLNEPDWTLFRMESKPLNTNDLESLLLLFQ